MTDPGRDFLDSRAVLQAQTTETGFAAVTCCNPTLRRLAELPLTITISVQPQRQQQHVWPIIRRPALPCLVACAV